MNNNKNGFRKNRSSGHNIPHRNTYTGHQGNGMFFGNQRSNVRERHKRSSPFSNIDFERVSEWPWIDIIGVAITIAYIIAVCVNYDSVTDELFSVLCPLISHLLVIVLVVGGIILLVLFFRRRRF